MTPTTIKGRNVDTDEAVLFTSDENNVIHLPNGRYEFTGQSLPEGIKIKGNEDLSSKAVFKNCQFQAQV